jgi:hypothetical protein
VADVPVYFRCAGGEGRQRACLLVGVYRPCVCKEPCGTVSSPGWHKRLVPSGLLDWPVCNWD